MVLLRSYYNSFTGLRKEVWWLALVTLINRAGTMVIPFLSLYLTSELDFTLEQVAWVMTAFGFGSISGSWIGGRLADSFGYYKVMFGSLFLSGAMFIGLQFIETFYGFCVGIYLIMTVADAFRPASQMAVSTYSKPENRTRSISLIRLAINLGFAIGPAVAGLVITAIGYHSLFWIDGITCMSAALAFVYLLRRKKAVKKDEGKEPVKGSPYSDKAYLVFLGVVFLVAFIFLQLFSTLPLYYRDFHHLSEAQIGWLFAISGIFIFAFEMPMMKYLEEGPFSVYRVLFVSTILFALSFFVLNIVDWAGMAIIGMLLLTVAEMLNFPFATTFALGRSEGKKQGSYMGLYTMAFASAFIVGQNAGIQMVEHLGFTITWTVMGGLGLLAALLVVWLRVIVKKENEQPVIDKVVKERKVLKRP